MLQLLIDLLTLIVNETATDNITAAIHGPVVSARVSRMPPCGRQCPPAIVFVSKFHKHCW